MGKRKKFDEGELVAKFGEKPICANCGRKTRIELHHVVPLFVGGKDAISNLVPLCDKCHMKAHQKIVLKAAYKPKRKPKAYDAKMAKVFDSYINCEITRTEANLAVGRVATAKLAQADQFKYHLKVKGIKRYRNNILIVDKNGVMHQGKHIGYVEYENGKRIDFYYNTFGKPERRVTNGKFTG